MEYKRSKHHIFLLNYHIIFCPKRRKAVLTGKIKKRFLQIVKNEMGRMQIEIIAIEVMPDHVHIFVSSSPKVPVHKIIKAIKGVSSRILRKEFPILLRIPSLWTHSYFVSTAGNISTSTVKKYIELQSKK